MRDHAELITAVGLMAEPAQGEMLTLSGRWEENAKYGMQFHIYKCESTLPATVTGIEKFLGSGLIRGIGPAMAKKIVDKFGEETIRVLDDEPARLAEIKGISENKAEAIAESWREQREIREVMVFLQSYGVGTGYAMRIFRQYGSGTVAVLKDNPYRMAIDIPGIGFTIADRIAQKLGISADSPMRVRAGVQHVLNQLIAEGHVYAPSELLAAHSAQTLQVTLDMAREGIEQARLAGEIIVERFADREGKEQEAVYLPAFHYAEVSSARNLRLLINEPYNSQCVDCDRTLPWLEREMGITLAQAQREAQARLAGEIIVERFADREGLGEDEYKKLFENKVLQTIKKLVAENIPNRFNFDPVSDIQVLAPMHNGNVGTKRLNLELQKILNTGKGASVQRLERVFKEGDKVMQIKNNYDKDVYNGDIGTITKVDGDESRVTVKMDTGSVSYEFAELEELVHAYAVSIHKSQGSEYPAVVIPLLTQHYVMLQRNLLYTAITRGKRLVVIVGAKKALRIAVENDRTRTRYTRLAQRLSGPEPPSEIPGELSPDEDELERMFEERQKKETLR